MNPLLTAALLLQSGILLDGEQMVAMVPDNAIVSIDLHDGSERWRSDHAARPFAGNGRVIVGHTARSDDGLDIVLLNANTGRKLRGCGTLHLPAYAPGIDPGLGTTLSLDSRWNGDVVDILWSSSAHYAGGPQPTEEIFAAHRKNDAGTYRCNTRTGRGEVVEHTPIAPPRLAPEPELPLLEASVPQPWTWRAQSADGEHVLVATQESTGVTVHLATAEGIRLSAVPNLEYGAPFVVRHSQYIVARGDTLTAYSVQDGEHTWTVPLRTPQYTGPRPQ